MGIARGLPHDTGSRKVGGNAVAAVAKGGPVSSPDDALVVAEGVDLGTPEGRVHNTIRVVRRGGGTKGGRVVDQTEFDKLLIKGWISDHQHQLIDKFARLVAKSGVMLKATRLHVEIQENKINHVELKLAGFDVLKRSLDHVHKRTGARGRALLLDMILDDRKIRRGDIPLLSQVCEALDGFTLRREPS